MRWSTRKLQALAALGYEITQKLGLGGRELR